jgi:uncharacterized protein (DUF2062 family)
MVRRHVVRMARQSVPSREALAQNRFLKPVAHRVLAPELWRFTRRSVPRGVALGLFVGILFLLPGAQIAGSALLALPLRANVPIAVAMTFLTNPVTTPFVIAISYYVGRVLFGRSGDMSEVMALFEHHATISQWLAWLLSETAPMLFFGLLVVALATSGAGYLLSIWLWRERMSRKWRRRAHRAGEGPPMASGDLGLTGGTS